MDRIEIRSCSNHSLVDQAIHAVLSCRGTTCCSEILLNISVINITLNKLTFFGVQVISLLTEWCPSPSCSCVFSSLAVIIVCHSQAYPCILALCISHSTISWTNTRCFCCTCVSKSSLLGRTNVSDEIMTSLITSQISRLCCYPGNPHEEKESKIHGPMLETCRLRSTAK